MTRLLAPPSSPCCRSPRWRRRRCIESTAPASWNWSAWFGTQLATMAKAAGGWDKLSGETKLDLGLKALADAVQLALELDVRSSLATCQRTLAPIKLFVQGVRP